MRAKLDVTNLDNTPKFIEVECPACKKMFWKCTKSNSTKSLPPKVLRCNAVYCSKICSRNSRDKVARKAAKERYFRNKHKKKQQSLNTLKDINKT